MKRGGFENKSRRTLEKKKKDGNKRKMTTTKPQSTLRRIMVSTSQNPFLILQTQEENGRKLARKEEVTNIDIVEGEINNLDNEVEIYIIQPQEGIR